MKSVKEPEDLGSNYFFQFNLSGKQKQPNTLPDHQQLQKQWLL